MSWHVKVDLVLGTLKLDVDLGGDDTPVALIGPNGSGKTTILRTIAGAYRPAGGHIRVGDRTLFDREQGVDLPPERRRVGYVPQGYGLFPNLGVLDNVGFGLIGSGTGSGAVRTAKGARRRIAIQLLDRMSCAHLAARTPSALSGGEQQRVALARALMTDPQLLLLDEPLSALDASARRALRRYLAEHLAERKTPAVVVTHDVRDILALDARVYVLESGRVVQQGPADALRARPVNDFVAEFFNSDATDFWRPDDGNA